MASNKPLALATVAILCAMVAGPRLVQPAPAAAPISARVVACHAAK